MLRFILASVCAAALASAAPIGPERPDVPARTLDATAFGAVADGHKDNAAALHRAIAAAAAAGGGFVVLPAAASPYLSGPLQLRSRVGLRIERGATLRALPYGAYPLSGRAYAHFISAERAHNIVLTGGGVIDGDGAAWWAAFRADKNMPHRPYLVRFTGCALVRVSDLTLVNSPMFHLAFNTTDHVTIEDVVIRAPENAPNSDGIDPGGSHYLIRRCDISTGDDNIAVKAGGSFCSDLVIADCTFGTGHGLSVGGQSNRGLDGLTVTNCTFNGTTSGLRLKADATQGGPVRNITYSNLTMTDVKYPIVFYSYYNRTGNPGNGKFPPAAAAAWNAAPPNSLASSTLPTWENITVTNLTVTGATGHSVIWGLPLAQGFFSNVRFVNLRYAGTKGFLLYNARDVQFSGAEFALAADAAPFASHNALAIVSQPASQRAKPGASATFEIAVAATATAIQWTQDGRPLADGPQPGGEVVAGAHTAKLTLTNLQPSATRRYAAQVTAMLDLYDPKAGRLAPAALPATATSLPAELTVAP
jgi:hypothetical protein